MSSAAPAMAPQVAPKTGDGGARSAALAPSRGLRLQRACSCGGSCDSCKKKPKETLQRKEVGGTAAASTKAPAATKTPAPSVKAPAAVAPPKASAPAGKVGADQAANPNAAAPQAVKTPPAKGDAAASKTTESKKAAGDGEVVPAVVKRVLQTAGQPLEPGTRFNMEGRFGCDFSGVRVHTDALAAESARAVSAHAYTVGQHIVFDAGLYRPQTPEGRKLLAHELAHTVQQHGLEKSADISMETGGEYHHLEREADRVAGAVMRGPAAGAPLGGKRSVGPVLSRVSTTDVISCDTDEEPRTWIPVTGKPNMAAAKVKQYSLPPVEAAKTPGAPKPKGKVIVAVDMSVPFDLPAEKGNVIEVWQQRMSGCNLEAIINPGEGSVRTKAGLKQARPGTDELHKIWLQKVGWTSDYKDKWLKAVKATPLAAGKSEEDVKKNSDFQPTSALGSKCQVDHILELQIGGNNTPENMQMLDGPKNEQSGREIFQDLAAKAVAVRNAMTTDVPDVQVESVLMRFSAIKPKGSPICGECCQADEAAKKITQEGKKDEGETSYDFVAGGVKTKVVTVATDTEVVALAGSAKNKAASTLIPGLSLTQWTRKKPIKPTDGGTVDAIIDPKAQEGKTALPSGLKGAGAIPLHRDVTTGKLKLAGAHPQIKFHYKYLSDGTFTSFKVEEDGTISGAGTIKPSFSFLPQFDVTFDKEKFALSKAIPKEKLKLPIPGLKITDASVALILGPEFKPEGHVGFELNAGAKKLLDGDITLSADEDGLLATGKVHAYLPGVDNAEGEIKLKNKMWSGSILIETSQIQQKLKYVKSGSVKVVFTNDAPGMAAEGTVVLDLPGTKGVEAKLLYDGAKKRWTFKGKGTFDIPKLKEAEMGIEYDGTHLTGGTGPGGIAFAFHGIDGVLHLTYRDEKISGAGKLNVKKGKTTGSITVAMRQAEDGPKFSGKGEVTYQLTENLIATAGIEIDEHEKVRLMGALAFPKPIPLFKPIEGNYKFFEVGVSIPIPGASIGPVGLKARIDGSMSAGYKLGPGELRDTKLEAAFNPLDEKPDVDVAMTSTLYIGASAYISGRIAGSIVVDAGLASVSGGLAITATANLDGHVGSQVKIHYQQSKVELDANFEMLVGLAITLALDAFVKAHAGIGPFSIDREKDWNLATYKYDTGMQFGMKLKNPLHYASDQPVQLPSFDDIQWTVPTLNPGDVMSKVFGNAGTKDQEKP